MGRRSVMGSMNPYMVSRAEEIRRSSALGLADLVDIGSAPDISGKGIVNPVAAILSTAMLLQYSLNLPEEAKAVEEAVKRTIDKGITTGDIGGKASTKEVGEATAKELEAILSGS